MLLLLLLLLLLLFSVGHVWENVVVVVAVVVVKSRCKKGLKWSSFEGLGSEQFEKNVLHYLLDKSNNTI